MDPELIKFIYEVKSLGVDSGDVLLVHSGLRRLIRRGLRPESIGAGLLELLGPSGTLLLPTFNFDWSESGEFDVRNTPSKMGTLTEWGRLRPDSIRTEHPMYSFAISGAQKDKFISDRNPSGYGYGSPFHTLNKLNGKILTIGLPWVNSMTFVHYAEEILQVPYRYFKSFPGEYTDNEGSTNKREYFVYVRDLEQGVETFTDDAESHCKSIGLTTHTNLDGCYMTLSSARPLCEELIKMIKAKPDFLYRIER
jgi:aminoglycoside 3-N-acetyltransferase